MRTRADIVVVEDDLEVRSLLVDILTGAGYEVASFEDAEAALYDLEREPGARLIILDVVMRPVSGFEFLSVSQALPELRDIPVLVCSGFGACERIAMPGAARVLLKPFVVDELLRAVGELILPPPPEGATSSPVATRAGVALSSV